MLLVKEESVFEMSWSLFVSTEGEHGHYWCPQKENMVIIGVHGRRTWSLLMFMEGKHGQYWFP